jgi:3-oxoacyl-[acyl-carrier-protein] synthase II
MSTPSTIAPRSQPSQFDTKPRQAVITGVGLLTPLGTSAQETWRALLDGRFITDHSRAAGEYDNASPRVIQMARSAADQAIRNAGWSNPATDDITTIVGTSKGSIESWIPHRPPLQHMSNLAYVAGGLSPTGLADIAAAVAPGCGARLTLSGACASGLLALIRAAMLIESGQATRVLVVAAEASVHPLFLGSFQRLGVLPKKEIGCRPFDQSRDGFLMSEAAAAICLESSAHHDQAQLTVVPRIAIEHYALGADATHLTSADPTGRVLRHLINKVAQSHPIDLIHAHGTGTIANDPIELAAIESFIANASQTPCLYSHKGALGHSLGAAGLVSVVLNVLAHDHDCVPPNIRTTQPLPTRHVAIRSTTHHTPVRRSLALAAGFGGATAAISLISL